MLRFIVKLIYRLRDVVANRTNTFGPQYFAFGVFGIVNYLLFYIVWRYISTESYENLTLRIIATVLCTLLILYKYWPRYLKPWLPLYWYITLLFCLPFFFTFLLLKNNLSNVWLMSTTVVMVWLMLLVDWLSFVVLLFLGVLLAWVSYRLTTHGPLVEANYYGLIAQYFGSIAVVLIFARNKEVLSIVKLNTIKSIGASMAHELRTPLSTISLNLSGIKKRLPLLEGKSAAIDGEQKELLNKLCDNAELEARAAFNVIDMLLIKANATEISRDKFRQCSMTDCIDKALLRYPFDKDERSLLEWRKVDFDFKGDELLMIHVLFNLFKNALYYIKAAGKGRVEIWCETTDGNNVLYFKDTGAGVSARILPNIFNQFFSKTAHGTGVGLYFCDIVMRSFGGDITCRSVEREYTEFTMRFPKLTK